MSEGIIEACPGGVEQHTSLSRGVVQNRSLSRGHLQVQRRIQGGGPGCPDTPLGTVDEYN